MLCVSSPTTRVLFLLVVPCLQTFRDNVERCPGALSKRRDCGDNRSTANHARTFRIPLTRQPSRCDKPRGVFNLYAYPAYRSLRFSFFALYRASLRAHRHLTRIQLIIAGISTHVSGMVCGIKKKVVPDWPISGGDRNAPGYVLKWRPGLTQTWSKRHAIFICLFFCFLSFFRIVYVNAVVHTSAILRDLVFTYVCAPKCVHGIYRRLRACACVHTLQTR